ncbi:hypothetical protein K432DRAFT_273653, partial [Lepidopterella palustris CBS 459.81]
ANRFLKQHPEVNLRTENPKELKRQAAEDPITLPAWYKESNRIVAIYNIIVGEIYNYNKIGVRLGIGKKEKLIITLK